VEPFLIFSADIVASFLCSVRQGAGGLPVAGPSGGPGGVSRCPGRGPGGQRRPGRWGRGGRGGRVGPWWVSPTLRRVVCRSVGGAHQTAVGVSRGGFHPPYMLPR